MINYREKKDSERHVFTKPIYVKTVVARTTRQELAGWGWEVYDGWGYLVSISRRVYATAGGARLAARTEGRDDDTESN